jgi:hypothetical protein
VERVDFLTGIGTEGDVEPRCVYLALADPEVGLAVLSEARYGTVELE